MDSASGGGAVQTTVNVVSIASCLAANRDGCQLGPLVLQHSDILDNACTSNEVELAWDLPFQPRMDLPIKEAIQELCARLRFAMAQVVADQNPFVVFGGDHSCAIGVWGGVRSVYAGKQDFGLIWVDAHMDSHDFSTSHSGNIHGMPVAALLGTQDRSLAKLCRWLKPMDASRLVLVGVRSYEAEEAQLLEQRGATVYDMDMIHSMGLDNVWHAAVDQVSRGGAAYGVSIDLDALDPDDAPGVGVTEPGGLSNAALCQVLSEARNAEQFIGLEIAEFNPGRDYDHRTEQCIADLVCATYGLHKTP